MQLTGHTDDFFTLKIGGYQFPKNTSGKHDSNWLIIEGEVGGANGQWSFRDACLLTWEVASLADWLEGLAAGSAESVAISFIEPHLEFVRTSGDTIQIYFDLEARPAWARSHYAGLRDLFIEVSPTASDLRIATSALRMQLARFPER